MANKQHLHKLLSDALPVLCRNGLPPYATFRVEAMIGITVVDEEGKDAVGDGNVTVLSFRQTVSEDGVITSKFGSNDAVASAADNGSTPSHTPRKHPAAKQAPTATITVKREYTVESSVKQEYDAETYPPHGATYTQASNTLEEYGGADGEVQYIGEDDDYACDEEYYEDDGQYYDDGTGYPPDVKYERQDGSYVEGSGDGSYMETSYMTDDYGQTPAWRPPKNKVAKPRAYTAGVQPGSTRGRKTGGAARGGTRPRAGKASQDQATAIAVR